MKTSEASSSSLSRLRERAGVRARDLRKADGWQHLDQIAYDARRTADMKQLGFDALRFWTTKC